MHKKKGLLEILRRVHDDEEGNVSLENVLIIAAIALPILIFLLRVGWPYLKGWFNREMVNVTGEAERGQNQ